jgi:hypothetical protein
MSDARSRRTAAAKQKPSRTAATATAATGEGRKTEPKSDVRRKLIEFDMATWHALQLLSRDSMKSWQELADEAFRDLLRKHKHPGSLREALKRSAAE